VIWVMLQDALKRRHLESHYNTCFGLTHMTFDYVGSYRRYKTRSEFNNWPVARTGHSLTQAHNVTFMFGGFINKYGKVKMHFTKIIAANLFFFPLKMWINVCGKP
jgi:hypothetical protein